MQSLNSEAQYMQNQMNIYPFSLSAGTSLFSEEPTARMQAWGGLIMAEKFLIPYIPKLEIVKVPPYKKNTFIVKFTRAVSCAVPMNMAETSPNTPRSFWTGLLNRSQGQQCLTTIRMSHLEFMRLKFTFSGFSCQRNHVLTNGSQALYMCIKHNRGDKPCRSTNCNANVHYVISARHKGDASDSSKITKKPFSWLFKQL